MFCQHCGAQIEDGMAFCTSCGAKQVAENKEETMSAAPAGQSQNLYQQPVNNQYAQPNAPFQNQFQQPVNNQYAQPNVPFQNQYQQPVNNQYVQPNAPFQQGNYQPAGTYNNGAGAAPKSVSFGEAIKLFFVNYVNFTGRSTKSEYWWAVLFNVLVSLGTAWIPGVGMLVSLAFLIPGLSLCIRRLHDIGKSWVWYLMGLIPLAGFIILIVFFCKDSDGDNQWGPAPRG